MKTLINPRLTFVLGVVIALVTVWCNAFPARVDAEEMSEATGGCYDKCVNDSDADCPGCEQEYNDCVWEYGDNNKVCDTYTLFKGCRSSDCDDYPNGRDQKSCQSF